MAKKKLSRNAPCPCGSGKKYKKCCWSKGFDFVEDDAGTISRFIPLDDEVMEILHEQRRRFVEKFGREPGPNDKVFFDMPPTEHIEAMTVKAMQDAGLDPALIYAFEKTGRLVTEDNMHLLPDADIQEWNAAIEEYKLKQDKGGS